MKLLRAMLPLSALAVACASSAYPTAPTTDAGFDGGTEPPAVPDGGENSADGAPDAAAPVDAGPRVDAAPPVDVPTAIRQFQDDQGTAICSALQGACGNPSAWNSAKCMDTYRTGFANLQEDLLVPGVVAGGRVTFDGTRAAACVAAIRQLPLPVRTEADQHAAEAACTAVVGGLQPVGGRCRASVECAAGTVCGAFVNGEGVCGGVGERDASCIYPTATRRRSNTCGSQGGADNGRFCSNTDNVSGRCVDKFSPDAPCVFDTQCVSGLCGPGAGGGTVCVTTYDELAANGTCAYFGTP